MAAENPPTHVGHAGTPWGAIVGVGLLLVGLVAIPFLVRAFDNSPEKWLRAHYEHVAGNDPDLGITFRADDTPAAVAAEITTGTEPTETHNDGERWFLRYDADYLVGVEPDAAGGSRIELLDFDEGYRRYGSGIGHWASYYGTGRGGGSGFGK